MSETFEFPRRWKATVEIKDLLSDDESPAIAILTGKAMAKRLREQLPAPMKNDPVLDAILTDFEEVEQAGRFALSAFNATLTDLYDWADVNRVWLGTM